MIPSGTSPAGTDPTDRGFQISRSILRDDGSFFIEWPTVRGKVYCVQLSTDLNAWTTIEPEFDGVDDLIDWSDPKPPGPRVYYRVVEKQAID